MTTQVMAGSYPDLLVATSEYDGVPFGCFAGSGEWNNACAGGQINKTGAQWVRSFHTLRTKAITERAIMIRVISFARRTQDTLGPVRG